ncbi:MAG: 2-amino-4-hydroxy-6-hydroxymethyldihydropteridine diphosphokinase, partial [Pseudomonadota bacterium]
MNDIIGTAGAPHDPSRLATDTTPAIVALGSNLGDREATIDRAIERIVRVIGPCHAQSRLIETEAWIHPDDDADWHPPFLNAVAVFDTGLGAAAILRHLLEIETSLGRERSADAKPWQPRPIDLDLIGVGAEVLDSPDLVLPH